MSVVVPPTLSVVALLVMLLSTGAVLSMDTVAEVTEPVLVLTFPAASLNELSLTLNLAPALVVLSVFV